MSYYFSFLLPISYYEVFPFLAGADWDRKMLSVGCFLSLEDFLTFENYFFRPASLEIGVQSFLVCVYPRLALTHWLHDENEQGGLQRPDVASWVLG